MKIKLHSFASEERASKRFCYVVNLELWELPYLYFFIVYIYLYEYWLNCFDLYSAVPELLQSVAGDSRLHPGILTESQFILASSKNTKC